MEDGGAIICSVDDDAGDALNDLRGETTPKGLMRRSVGEKSKADVSWRHDRARITMDVMVEFILREFWLWRGVVSLSKIRCTRYDILWTVDLLICRSWSSLDCRHWCEWSLGLFHCILMTSCSCFVRLSVTVHPCLGVFAIPNEVLSLESSRLEAGFVPLRAIGRKLEARFCPFATRSGPVCSDSHVWILCCKTNLA